MKGKIMAKTKLAKSQRVTVSKRKLSETADEMEQLAVVTAVDGELKVMDGSEKMAEAADLAATGAVLMGKGASDLTRAEDEKIMAGRMAVVSEVVGAAGVTDIEEGIEMLAASEDVNVVSALMGLMSLEDIEHGLELARLSGEMQTAGELVEAIKMPVLAGFLTKRSARLHEMSLEQIRTAVSTKAVSQVLSTAGKKIEALGENEMDEGVTRLTISTVVKEESAAISRASDELGVKGFEEVVVGAEVGRLARAQAMESAAEISNGSAQVGAALALQEVATSLKKKSEK
jgi:hypothetical protein